MTTTIPDYIPELTHGAGETAKTGGCLMQIVSWFADGEWDDSPNCVWSPLRSWGIRMNDAIHEPAVRRQLWTAVPRLMSTGRVIEGMSGWSADPQLGDQSEETHRRFMELYADFGQIVLAKVYSDVGAQKMEDEFGQSFIDSAEHALKGAVAEPRRRGGEAWDVAMNIVGILSSPGYPDVDQYLADLMTWTLDAFDQWTGTRFDPDAVPESEWKALTDMQRDITTAAADQPVAV